MKHDLDRLNDELRKDIDAVVKRLFRNADKRGGFWYLGGLDDSPGTRLVIWRSGQKAGEWCDFSAKKGGGPLGLFIEAAEGGGGNAGVGIREAAKFLNIKAEETPEEKARREARAQQERERLAREEEVGRRRKTKAAQALFLHGGPIAGTMADDYLLGRAIDLRLLRRQPGGLRFHPAVRCPETQRDRPALLIAVANEQGYLTCHRTFLFRVASGRVVKADSPEVPTIWRMKKAKQVYSAVKGGIASIWRGDSAKRLKDMPDGEWIILTEGLEDAMSFAIAQPEMRVACVVALPFLGAAFLPQQCGGVFWHRHRGDGAQAVADLEQQYRHLERRGLPIKEVWAPDGEKDMNAWLMKQQAVG